MRSIISISALFLSTVALHAQAPLGCFQRTYDEAHLAKHPDQVVRHIALLITKDDGDAGQVFADMGVEFTRQGHLEGRKLGGSFQEQFLICSDEAQGFSCFVECDGGSFVITRETSDSLTFETRYLLVGDTGECGGAVDLAERPGVPVKYKLFRAGPDACVWN